MMKKDDLLDIAVLTPPDKAVIIIEEYVSHTKQRQQDVLKELDITKEAMHKWKNGGGIKAKREIISSFFNFPEMWDKEYRKEEFLLIIQEKFEQKESSIYAKVLNDILFKGYVENNFYKNFEGIDKQALIVQFAPIHINIYFYGLASLSIKSALEKYLCLYIDKDKRHMHSFENREYLKVYSIDAFCEIVENKLDNNHFEDILFESFIDINSKILDKKHNTITDYTYVFLIRLICIFIEETTSYGQDNETLISIVQEEGMSQEKVNLFNFINKLPSDKLLEILTKLYKRHTQTSEILNTLKYLEISYCEVREIYQKKNSLHVSILNLNRLHLQKLDFYQKIQNFNYCISQYEEDLEQISFALFGNETTLSDYIRIYQFLEILMEKHFLKS
jgi:hypothetical protein